jgi:hypothetical protein
MYGFMFRGANVWKGNIQCQHPGGKVLKRRRNCREISTAVANGKEKSDQKD